MCSTSWPPFIQSWRCMFVIQRPRPACAMSPPAQRPETGAVCSFTCRTPGFQLSESKRKKSMHTVGGWEGGRERGRRERQGEGRKNFGLALRRHGALQELTDAKN